MAPLIADTVAQPPPRATIIAPHPPKNRTNATAPMYTSASTVRPTPGTSGRLRIAPTATSEAPAPATTAAAAGSPRPMNASRKDTERPRIGDANQNRKAVAPIVLSGGSTRPGAVVPCVTCGVVHAGGSGSASGRRGPAAVADVPSCATSRSVPAVFAGNGT